jgi:carboxyl-terminal processing protease
MDQQTEIEIENEYLTALGKDPIRTLEDQEPVLNRYKEILLQQAEKIMADMILLTRQQGYAW